MVHAFHGVPGRDGEVDARILDHPLRIVGLAYRRLCTEQPRIEADARIEIGNADVHMEALHATLLLDDFPARRERRGADCESAAFAAVAHAGAHSVRHTPLRTQQFSVRYSTKPFMAG